MKKNNQRQHQLRLAKKVIRQLSDTTMKQVAGGDGEGAVDDDKTIGLTSCCFTGVPSCY